MNADGISLPLSENCPHIVSGKSAHDEPAVENDKVGEEERGEQIHEGLKEGMDLRERSMKTAVSVGEGLVLRSEPKKRIPNPPLASHFASDACLLKATPNAASGGSLFDFSKGFRLTFFFPQGGMDGYVLTQPTRMEKKERQRKKTDRKSALQKSGGDKRESAERKEDSGKRVERKEDKREERGEKREKREGRERQVDWSKGDWNERFQEIMGQVKRPLTLFKRILFFFLYLFQSRDSSSIA
jgi:hypothetical protein